MTRQQHYTPPSFSAPKPENLFLASENALYTYQNLKKYQAFFLRQLYEFNADLERPVGFLTHSCDELIFAIASCWRLGIPFVCFSPTTASSELQYQIDSTKPGILISEEGHSYEALDQNLLPLREIAVEKALGQSYHTEVIDKDFKAETDPEQIFGYFFTSGTSDTPKLVPLKRRQMLFAAAASADNFRPDPNHFWLLCLPLNHVGGISIILRSLLYGSGIYRMNSFDRNMVSTFLSENKLFQAASLVPTMLKRLIEIPAFHTHKKFKAILLGGGPSNISLIKESVSKGIPVVSSYGMTETCAQIAANSMLKPSGMYIPTKSVGKVFQPNKIEIRNDDGQKLAPNTSGTIWLKGPQVFDGYQNEDLNERAFSEDGWFNTGDYGHMNANGHLFMESRRSDLIITGGENVSPHELEEELKGIDSIEEAAVLGLPDDEWGQQVVAAVVSSNKKAIHEQEIRQTLKKRLTSFKVPKRIIRVDSLPKNQTGKIIRSELGKLFE